MNPKKTAEDIYKKILYFTTYANSSKAAKLCIITIIDEVLATRQDFKYWQEVKNHIESMD